MWRRRRPRGAAAIGSLAARCNARLSGDNILCDTMLQSLGGSGMDDWVDTGALVVVRRWAGQPGHGAAIGQPLGGPFDTAG